MSLKWTAEANANARDLEELRKMAEGPLTVSPDDR